MLRVGLTGGLGAGKSTVARMLAARGAIVLESDALGRELMQPGEPMFAAIVACFGSGVLRVDGTLDRAALARLAFDDGRVEELNAIVHPAVIALQEDSIAAMPSDAIVVIESALIFETMHGGEEGWRTRFDKIVLVTAPEKVKIARFVERSGSMEATRGGLEAEARRRLAAQMPDAAKVAFCDYVLSNGDSREVLAIFVDRLWADLERNNELPATDMTAK